MGTNEFIFIIGLGTIVILFFLFREISLWYFKINERTKIAKEQLEISKKILTAIVNLETKSDIG